MKKKKTPLARYVAPEESATILSQACSDLGSEEVAVVKNLGHSFSPLSLYPLAPRNVGTMDRIAAFAVDMDGTSTTTEPLALRALEYMVRAATGRMDPNTWSGLDKEKDYPFIIGNSNFFHTEFLLRRYEKELREDALRDAFFHALIWTMANMPDAERTAEVQKNALHCGMGSLLGDPSFRSLPERGELDNSECIRQSAAFLKTYGSCFKIDHFGERVRAALDIYYYRYHSILKAMEKGEGKELSRELLGRDGERLIAPMPGYSVFLALIKGWLGEGAGPLYPELARELSLPAEREEEGRERLASLGRRFRAAPAKIALVTASIAFEAHAVMKEVLRTIREEVGGWNLPEPQRLEIQEKFAEVPSVFESFVTASDSHEGRLKPHPDLYSLALYQMSIPPGDYCLCMGIEDTEPGIVALRAAGFHTAVALPNKDTTGQNYAMASHVVGGGLPELILEKNLFLQPRGEGETASHG